MKSLNLPDSAASSLLSQPGDFVPYAVDMLAVPAAGAPCEPLNGLEKLHEIFGRGMLALDKLQLSGWDNFSKDDYTDLRAITLVLAVHNMPALPDGTETNESPAPPFVRAHALHHAIGAATLEETGKQVRQAAVTLYDILLTGTDTVTGTDIHNVRSIAKKVYNATRPTEPQN